MMIESIYGSYWYEFDILSHPDLVLLFVLCRQFDLSLCILLSQLNHILGPLYCCVIVVTSLVLLLCIVMMNLEQVQRMKK